MESLSPSPRLARIRLHPIKSLDPIEVNEARIGPGGGLELDRAWALYSVDGQWVNGKRAPAIFLIRASYAPDLRSVTLSAPADVRELRTVTVAFPGDTAAAEAWFSQYFDQTIIVRYRPEGFPDDALAFGPTIVSTASLQATCDLFPGMTLQEVRMRFRTTLELDGVPAFWEDQLFGEEERSAVRFRIGDVAFEGSNPCARCPVPPRHPMTGEILTGFQKAFSDFRRAQLPPWSPESRFDHFYRLSTNTRVAPTEHGKLLHLGDALTMF